MPKKIYIAGKITGDPNYQLKFIRARQHLTKEGYTVLTPAVLPEGMTKADYNAFDRCGNGCVIGEFVCDEIQNFIWVSDDLPFGDGGEYYLHDEELKAAGMSYQQFEDYGQKQDLYGWHISELKIYPTPKAITEFRSYNCGVRWEDGLPIPDHEIKRAPQSWCYVENL